MGEEWEAQLNADTFYWGWTGVLCCDLCCHTGVEWIGFEDMPFWVMLVCEVSCCMEG